MHVPLASAEMWILGTCLILRADIGWLSKRQQRTNVLLPRLLELAEFCRKWIICGSTERIDVAWTLHV